MLSATKQWEFMIILYHMLKNSIFALECASPAKNMKRNSRTDSKVCRNLNRFSPSRCELQITYAKTGIYMNVVYATNLIVKLQSIAFPLPSLRSILIVISKLRANFLVETLPPLLYLFKADSLFTSFVP